MKVLFFSPYAATWPHAFPEALLAEAVAGAGHEALCLHCDGAYAKLCLCMISAGLGVDAPVQARENICRACRTNRDIVRRRFRLPSLLLDRFIDDAMRQHAAALVETVTPDNLFKLTVAGVKVGRNALFETLMGSKKITLAFTPDQWRLYLVSLENALLTLFAFKRLKASLGVDRLVSFNGAYACNHTLIDAAEKSGIPAYMISSGFSMSRMYQSITFGRQSNPVIERSLIAAWPRYAGLPADASGIGLVREQLQTLFEAKLPFIYSQAASVGTLPDIRAHFGIRPDQKILLAVLSSYDEGFTAHTIGIRPKENIWSSVFPSQVDWIRFLADYARQHDELYFLIRVHPREFPNKRNSTLSEHARILQQSLTDLPANMRVNWPEDNLSIYDLMEEVAVGLTFQSSTGVEMAAMGIPVVSFDKALLCYPPDLNYFGTSIPEYLANIEQALADGWSFERIRRTFRWLAMLYGVGSLDISPRCPYDGAPPTGPVTVVLAGKERTVLHQELHCAQRAPLPELQKAVRLMELGLESLPAIDDPTARAATEAEETDRLADALAQLARVKYARLDQPARPGTLRHNIEQTLCRLGRETGLGGTT
ncbi:hypothetical protein [Solidesulfovibrio sp.]